MLNAVDLESYPFSRQFPMSCMHVITKFKSTLHGSPWKGKLTNFEFQVIVEFVGLFDGCSKTCQ